MSRQSFPYNTFTNADGNPLANGYVDIGISEDVNSSEGLISGGALCRYSLDENGEFITTPQLWANVDLTPAGSSYSVAAYTAEGELTFCARNVTVTPTVTTWTVYGTTYPWVVAAGNSAYPFAKYEAVSGTHPIVVPCNPGDNLSITATGIVYVSPGGEEIGPDGDDYETGYLYPNASIYPTFYVYGEPDGPVKLGGLMGAFTDASGKVIQPVAIGASSTQTAPVGAVQLQLGINDINYGDNSGSFTVTVTKE